jgi:hypothetical protein
MGPTQPGVPAVSKVDSCRRPRMRFISRCAIRAETVYSWMRFGRFGLALNEEQIPQIVENNKNHVPRWAGWKYFFCAQGRCATRLRYAPTVLLVILNYFFEAHHVASGAVGLRDALPAAYPMSAPCVTYDRPRNWMMWRRSRFEGRPAGSCSNWCMALRSAATFIRRSRLASVSR